MSKNIEKKRRHKKTLKLRRKAMGIPRRIPAEVREEVERRCACWCEFCWKREGREFHHITPQRDGGKHTPENLKYVCERCALAAHRESDSIRHKIQAKADHENPGIYA